MRITAVLPVSRIKYLDRVLESLDKQTLKPDDLIVIFDGEDKEFQQVKEKVASVSFTTLCVKSTNTRPAFAIAERRQHIANIHNQARTLIEDADWVFAIEDDGILPPDALSKLVAEIRPDTGLVTGVELGRWGVPYVGAWVVDDIIDTKEITSLQNKAGQELVEIIDACGLYCALIRADKYKQHLFDARNGLGPDVNLAIFLRRGGYQNYINWAIPVTHLTSQSGVEIEIPATDFSYTVKMSLAGTNTWAQVKY